MGGEIKGIGGSYSFRCSRKIENSDGLKILGDLRGLGWIPAPKQLLGLDS